VSVKNPAPVSRALNSYPASQVSYQALDRRCAPSLDDVRRMTRDPTTPTLADSGVLANVSITDGRAEGTLGARPRSLHHCTARPEMRRASQMAANHRWQAAQSLPPLPLKPLHLQPLRILNPWSLTPSGQEEKLKAMRRKLTPNVTLATSEVGSLFGGGRLLMGAGELQASLKVVAMGPLEVFCAPAEALLRVAPPSLTEALRSHIAFNLTYWFSRVGMLDSRAAVGHEETGLVQGGASREAEAPGKKRDKRRTGAKAAERSASGFSPKVEACLAHVERLKVGVVGRQEGFGGPSKAGATRGSVVEADEGA